MRWRTRAITLGADGCEVDGDGLVGLPVLGHGSTSPRRHRPTVRTFRNPAPRISILSNSPSDASRWLTLLKAAVRTRALAMTLMPLSVGVGKAKGFAIEAIAGLEGTLRRLWQSGLTSSSRAYVRAADPATSPVLCKAPGHFRRDIQRAQQDLELVPRRKAR